MIRRLLENLQGETDGSMDVAYAQPHGHENTVCLVVQSSWLLRLRERGCRYLRHRQHSHGLDALLHELASFHESGEDIRLSDENKLQEDHVIIHVTVIPKQDSRNSLFGVSESAVAQHLLAVHRKSSQHDMNHLSSILDYESMRFQMRHDLRLATQSFLDSLGLSRIQVKLADAEPVENIHEISEELASRLIRTSDHFPCNVYVLDEDTNRSIVELIVERLYPDLRVFPLQDSPTVSPRKPSLEEASKKPLFEVSSPPLAPVMPNTAAVRASSHPNLLPIFAALATQDAYYFLSSPTSPVERSVQLLDPVLSVSAAKAVGLPDHTKLRPFAVGMCTIRDIILLQSSRLSGKSVHQQFIAYQLLHFLSHLHKTGLTHGHLHSSKILLDEHLWVQIAGLDCIMPNMNFALNEFLPPSVCEKNIVEQWMSGDLSNYQYLMFLNHAAGRRLKGDPNMHPILPWVLDLSSDDMATFRDLTKTKYRLNKGDEQLDVMYRMSQPPHHVPDSFSDITFYVYTARRTPVPVLQQYVRARYEPNEYPSSIGRLYQWTPDECIPSFFTDPTVFESIHPDMPSMLLPVWAKDARDFIEKHAAALESIQVTQMLHHWIDLTFGFKLTGTEAFEAKNVSLPLVPGAPNMKHGVVQLFKSAHPARLVATPARNIIQSLRGKKESIRFEKLHPYVYSTEIPTITPGQGSFLEKCQWDLFCLGCLISEMSSSAPLDPFVEWQRSRTIVDYPCSESWYTSVLQEFQEFLRQLLGSDSLKNVSSTNLLKLYVNPVADMRQTSGYYPSAFDSCSLIEVAQNSVPRVHFLDCIPWLYEFLSHFRSIPWHSRSSYVSNNLERICSLQDDALELLLPSLLLLFEFDECKCYASTQLLLTLGHRLGRQKSVDALLIPVVSLFEAKDKFYTEFIYDEKVSANIISVFGLNLYAEKFLPIVLEGLVRNEKFAHLCNAPSVAAKTIVSLSQRMGRILTAKILIRPLSKMLPRDGTCQECLQYIFSQLGLLLGTAFVRYQLVQGIVSVITNAIRTLNTRTTVIISKSLALLEVTLSCLPVNDIFPALRHGKSDILPLLLKPLPESISISQNDRTELSYRSVEFLLFLSHLVTQLDWDTHILPVLVDFFERLRQPYEDKLFYSPNLSAYIFQQFSYLVGYQNMYRLVPADVLPTVEEINRTSHGVSMTVENMRRKSQRLRESMSVPISTASPQRTSIVETYFDNVASFRAASLEFQLPESNSVAPEFRTKSFVSVSEDRFLHQHDHLSRTALSEHSKWLEFMETISASSTGIKDQLNLTGDCLRMFHGHTGVVKCVTYSDSLNCVLSGSKDRSVKLWRLDNPQPHFNKDYDIATADKTYNGHRNAVHCVATLWCRPWVMSFDGRVHIWEPESARSIHHFNTLGSGQLTIMHTLQDQRLLVCGSSDGLLQFMDPIHQCNRHVWKTVVGKLISAQVNCIDSFGYSLAVGLSSGAICIVDTRTGKIQSNWQAHEDAVFHLLFVSECLLISASSVDRRIHLWQPQSASFIRSLSILNASNGDITNLSFDGFDTLVVTLSTQFIIQYSLSEKNAAVVKQIHSKTASTLTTHSFLPTHGLILAGSEEGEIYLYR